MYIWFLIKEDHSIKCHERSLTKNGKDNIFFLETQLFYAKHDNMTALIKYLEHTKKI